MTRLLLLVFCLWSGAVCAGSKLTSVPSDAWHLLGDSISVSGNTAAIAANGTGQVYIREYQAGTGWVTTKVIGAVGTTTGGIVRLTTNHLAVRTFGKLQMYGRNKGGTGNWGLEQELTISAQGLAVVDGDRMLVGASTNADEYQWDSGTGQWIKGNAVGSGLLPLALSGNTAVLGLPSSSNFSTTLTVFERGVTGQWTQTAMVNPITAVDHDYFGEAVALDGDWLVVGAPAWFSPVNTHGAAFVYSRNQGGANAWGAVQTLTPVGNVVEFGTSVSISGTRVAVGMEEGDSTVHVFERTGSTYSLKGRFRPGISYSDSFGRELGLAGDQLVASDLWRGTPNNYAGMIFQFDVTTGQSDTIATENGIFTSTPESVGDKFGSSAAMDGQTLVIGAPMADNPMSDCGMVSIYSRQGDGTWILAKTLAPADAAIQGYFGWAVALQGDTLAVSAPGTQSVYIFGRDTGGVGQWGLIKELTSRYVQDLSLDGDTLAGTSSSSNIIYLFERNAGGANNWAATTLSLNCSQVSVSGNTLVGSGNSSAATMYVRSALGATDWHFSATFSTAFPFYIWAASSLDGDTVAIAGVDSTSGSRPPEIVSIRQRNQGGANQWGEVARLSPFDRTGKIKYGTDVKLKGARLVVGAPGDTTAGTAAGSVYVYEGSADKTTWTLIRKMSAFDPLASDLFGTSVDTNGDDVVGGAPGHSGAGTGAGAAYVSTTQSHLSEWLATNAPGVTGDPKTVDTNGDGLSLYAKYAMGLGAAAVTGTPLTPLTNAGSGNCTFDYSVAKDAPDVLTTVLWSTDLQTWRALGDGLSFSSTLLSETRDAWRYRATVPTGSLPNLFMRLSFAPRP